MFNEADFIQKQGRMIELVMESFGINVRVGKIDIQPKYYEYCLEIAVGTDLKELEKHTRDLAMALASPTGKVSWRIPIPGTIFAGLKVPKPTKEYLESLDDDESYKKKQRTPKQILALSLFLIGNLLHKASKRLSSH